MTLKAKRHRQKFVEAFTEEDHKRHLCGVADKLMTSASIMTCVLGICNPPLLQSPR